MSTVTVEEIDAALRRFVAERREYEQGDDDPRSRHKTYELETFDRAIARLRTERKRILSTEGARAQEATL